MITQDRTIYYELLRRLRKLQEEIRCVKCENSGGGLAFVTTTNSSNISFTGTGTTDNPLSATITGGVIQTASNGLYVDGTEVKLGSNYTVDDAGQITTQVAIGSGSLFGGTFNGVIIDPTSSATQISNGDFYLEVGNDHFILTNQASNSTIESLASTNFLRLNGSGGELSISNDELLITSLNGATYAADYSANYTDRSLVDKAFVDLRIPAPPTTGTFILQSVDGVVSWVTP